MNFDTRRPLSNIVQRNLSDRSVWFECAVAPLARLSDSGLRAIYMRESKKTTSPLNVFLEFKGGKKQA